MKILVTSVVDLKKTAHNRIHQFVKHLNRKHEIVVLSINDWWKADQTKTALYNQGLENTFTNVRIEYFTQRRMSPTLQELTSIFALSDILKKIHYQDFDVHFNYNSLISGYIISRYMKSAGINTIYDVADDLPAMIRVSPQIPALLRPVGGFVGSVAFNKNISISNKTTIIAESLRFSLKIPMSKCTIIPNGVDIELFKDRPSDEIKRKLNIHDTFVIGYVGVLREWVDLETVFSAARSVMQEKPEINLRVLIVGEEGGLTKNKKLAQKYGISNQVIFTGTVPYEHVPDYISCMDICLIPFKKGAVAENALPLKLLEYMACGKPVVSTPLAGVKEAIQNRVNYALNTNELKENIIKLFYNDERRKNMGVEGKNYITNNYSWSRLCTILEQLLLETSKDK